MGYAQSGGGPRPEQDDDSKMHAKVEKSGACRIAVQMLPHTGPNSNQIEQKQHAPTEDRRCFSLESHGFEETLDNLEHAYSAALDEHTSRQSRLDSSNSGSKL